MKNKLFLALALTGVVGTLVACGGNETPSTPAAPSENTSVGETTGNGLSIGVGMISAEPALSYGAPQLELNFATAVYNGDDVVSTLVDVYQVPLSKESCAIDTSKDFATETNVLTKRDRHDGYAMKPASPIGKEWWEQAAVLESYVEGNIDEETYTAGCTMLTDTLVAAVNEAKVNAKGAVTVNSGNYTIALGHHIAFDGEEVLTQVNITVIGLLLDSNSKIVTSYLDEIQIPLTFTAGEANPYTITPTNAYGSPTTQYNYKGQTIASKKELGDDYDMKKASPIGKEWWEQAAALEDYLVGKTVTELDAYSEDLTAGCTMYTGSYFAAITNAVDSSLYNTKAFTL